jgi:Kef-type K+ transport system membrane component KefB
MGNLGNLLLILTGFAIVGAASGTIAKVFQRIKLPLITGFLVVGIIAGPYVVGLIPKKSVHDLYFINHISLTFIAFAAGSELYLKDMRSRFKSIAWMTFGQLVVTFLASSIIIFYLADYIHFMATMSSAGKLAVAMLIATIFVARSPASAIAIINELRARGPFTQTAIGVTVVKDVLVEAATAVRRRYPASCPRAKGSCRRQIYTTWTAIRNERGWTTHRPSATETRRR